MKEYNSTRKFSYFNNYSNRKIENYNSKNEIEDIYIDTLDNENTIERQILNPKKNLKQLIKYKYSNGKTTEIIVYDSIGAVKSKETYSYSNNKPINTIEYDEFGKVTQKIIYEYTDKIQKVFTYDKEEMLDFYNENTITNDLITNSKSIYIDEKDSTKYRTEITYQDSIFYNRKIHYKNNELDYAEVFKIYKRK
jgi:hypothetical protein